MWCESRLDGPADDQERYGGGDSHETGAQKDKKGGYTY